MKKKKKNWSRLALWSEHARFLSAALPMLDVRYINGLPGADCGVGWFASKMAAHKGHPFLSDSPSELSQ